MRIDGDGGSVVGEGILTGAGPAPGPGFHRMDGALRCDDLAVADIVDRVGTPAYIYSAPTIRTQYRRLTTALAGIPHRVHYSVKANSSLGILGLLRELGAGVDIVSGGELHRALLAGFRGRDVVFSGVGKQEHEIRDAVAAGVRFFNVESEGELAVIDRVGRALGVRVPVALRVNPEVTVDTPHHYTRTGEKGMKFGIPHDQAHETGRRALAMAGVELVGLDMHVGSQVAGVEPYRVGMDRLVGLVHALRADGASSLKALDVGGGLAVQYDVEDDAPADVDAFAGAINRAIEGMDLEVIVEPGRFLVADAGILVTRVLYRKHSGGREIVIVDAGMNDLLRPSHYNAYHRVEAVTRRDASRETVDLVGPICETGDFLALDREIDRLEPGDLVAVHTAGAYGFAMASQYNSRPRPPEILVDAARWAVIRERETNEDLVRHESAHPDWRFR